MNGSHWFWSSKVTFAKLARSVLSWASSEMRGWRPAMEDGVFTRNLVFAEAQNSHEIPLSSHEKCFGALKFHSTLSHWIYLLFQVLYYIWAHFYHFLNLLPRVQSLHFHPPYWNSFELSTFSSLLSPLETMWESFHISPGCLQVTPGHSKIWHGKEEKSVGMPILRPCQFETTLENLLFALQSHNAVLFLFLLS